MPQYVASSFSLSVPRREPSRSGEPRHPPTTPSPWSYRPPGPLPPPECRPSGASAASHRSSRPRARPTRRGVPVFPYSRFAAPESALHRRRINTGRHPNSLEVNASFPRAPTTSTSYLPYPTTSFQKPDEDSRPRGEATSTSDAASIASIVRARCDATRLRPTDDKHRMHR